jgi:uncharacterized SAM-binding protein YcdF (DUF218 family)
LSDAEPVIVVFGARVRADGTPSATLIRRVDAAFSAAAMRAGSRIIVTGGRIAPAPVAEAEVMRNLLMARGVDAARITVESRARDTVDSVRRLGALLGNASVVIATSFYHVPRCRMLLALYGVRVAGIVTPLDENRRMSRFDRWNAVLHEALSLPWSLIRALVRSR